MENKFYTSETEPDKTKYLWIIGEKNILVGYQKTGKKIEILQVLKFVGLKSPVKNSKPANRITTAEAKPVIVALNNFSLNILKTVK